MRLTYIIVLLLCAMVLINCKKEKKHKKNKKHTSTSSDSQTENSDYSIIIDYESPYGGSQNKHKHIKEHEHSKKKYIHEHDDSLDEHEKPLQELIHKHKKYIHEDVHKKEHDTSLDKHKKYIHKHVHKHIHKKDDSINGHNVKDDSIFDLKNELMRRFIFNIASTRKSLVCSPVSALLPLGKLAFGAKDQTLNELLEAIGVNSLKRVESRFKKYLKDMRKLKGVTLAVASRIYLNKHKKLKKSFKYKTKKVFKSGVEKADMSDPSKVVQNINSWVHRETHGMMKEILRPTDLSTKMNLIVVNAVYFKGKWKYPFDQMKAGTFYGSSGERAVSMMKITENFEIGASSTLSAKIIKIPYKQAEANLIIILPNSRTGLSTLMSQLKLAPNLLNTFIMKKKKVKLYLPKFSIESEINLEHAYKLCGVREIFSDNTGLQKIIRDGKVKVDMAKQKVFFEVTSEGTKAEAGGIGVEEHLVSLDDDKFEAYHPFLFFVLARGKQLFAGVFTAS